MTAQEILNSVRINIDQTDTDGFWSDANLLDILNEGYIDFTRFTMMRFKATDVVVSALNPWVEVPEDFIQSTNFRWGSDKQLYPKSERSLDYDQRDWVYEVGSPLNVVFYSWNQVRVKPIPSSAGTLKFRHMYTPSEMTLTDSPDIPEVWHDALEYYVSAQCCLAMREIANATRWWKGYISRRQKARAQNKSRTPDILESQRNVNVFNYGLWDQGYRVR